MVLVDFRVVFNTTPRDRALAKRTEVKALELMLDLLVDVLQPKGVVVDDGVVEHEMFSQTTGFPQGDSLSPLLF